MSDIRPFHGEVSVLFKGRVIARSHEAQALYEGAHKPVYYLPRAALVDAKLEPCARRTHCPDKGQASYYMLVTTEGDASAPCAVWSYEAAYDEAAALTRLIAFDGNAFEAIVAKPA